MMLAATKSGMSGRTGRPLGPLTGGLTPPPSHGAFIFPGQHAYRTWPHGSACKRTSVPQTTKQDEGKT